MTNQLRVLIVEDSESDALLLLRALAKADYDPISERVDSEAALRSALQSSSWDIVLTDYSLPGFSGLGALAVVRQAQGDLPVIFLSGAVGEDAAVTAMKAGAQDFILKGNLSRLAPAIGRELREAEVQRAWKHAEEEVKRRDALFRSVIENGSELIVILDQWERIRYQSPSIQRVLGYRPSELFSTSALEHVHPDDQETVRAALKLRGSSSRLEYRVRHRDGSWRILEGVITDRTKDAAVRGIICSSRDITERKQLEAELRHAQRIESLGSLTSGIAHDLNNLLTPILIGVDALADELAGSEYQPYLEGIQSSANRGVDLVQHLLAFARDFRHDRTTVDPTELLGELDRLLRFGLPKNIRRRIVISKGLWPVFGDSTEILQVLMNLCINARDAMPEGGKLIIDAENVVLTRRDLGQHAEAEPGPYIQFHVTDKGEGIPESVRERMFEPFFTTKGQGKGTGLGLSTSLSIVRAHGGLIKVYSELGRGTRFSVHLPALPTPDTKIAERDAGDLPRGEGQLVLVVDDETAIREIVKEALETYGYRTLTASNGAEALAVYAEQGDQIDMALVDMEMPLMDGPTTIQELRKRGANFRIVAQGGFVRERPDLQLEDIQDILEKPYTIERLLWTIAREFENPASN